MIRKLKQKYDGFSQSVRATFWFLVCSILQRGISTITTPIFTRLMSTAEYGQYGVFNSLLSITQIIVTLELTAGVYAMGIVKFKEEEAVFSSSLQGLNLVLCTAWTLIYLLFRDFWNALFSLSTVQMLAMLLMVWASAAFTFWMTFERNHYSYRKVIIITLIVSVLKPVVGIFLVYHAQDKVTARILGLALVEVICYSGCFFIQMKRGRVFFSGKFWKYAILFNLPLLPHYLAGTILSSADRIMIKRMVGDSQAGIYTLAYSVSMIMNLVKDSLKKTINPYLYQKIRQKDYRRMERVVYPALIIIAMANLMLIAFAPEAIALFAPKEYMEAIYVIPPVAMSVYVQFLYLCFAPFEFYFEKRLWTTIGTLVSAVFNVILNAIFIAKCGYQAAGYTTLFCYMVNSIMHYFFMRRVCRTYLEDVKPYNPRIIVAITLCFLGIGFLYILTYSRVLIRYIFTAAIFMAIMLNRRRIMTMVREMGLIKAPSLQRV